MKNLKTYFCSITMNRWYQYEEVVRNIYHHVDYIICIDGGSKDGTVDGLRQISNGDYIDIYYHCNNDLKKNDLKRKVIIVHKPWTDNFPEQRQAYLDTVRMLREKDEISWVCVSDSDEYYSERLRKGLKKLCEYATNNNYDCIGIRSKGITYNENKEIAHLTYDDFWKPLIYKFDSDRRIVGVSPDGSSHNVHEGFSKPFTKFLKLPSKENEGIENELVYEHVKDPGDVWQRGHARNFYAGGGGPNLGNMQPLWEPFRKLVKECMVEDGWNEPKTWWDYDAYLKKGNINSKLKEWFIYHMFEGEKERPNIYKATIDGVTKDFSPSTLAETKLGRSYDGASEIREGYKYYFRYLHPEEEPKELKQYHIG